MARVQRVAEVRSEELLMELLRSQGWDTRRPPSGELLRQQEYRDHGFLAEVLKGSSKSGGGGHGRPEAFLVDREVGAPLAVIEVKSSIDAIDQASIEATEVYGSACVRAGYSPLAIALAGSDEDNFLVRVFKWQDVDWVPVTYEGNPINWIPNRNDLERLTLPSSSAELRPSIPPAEVLAARAEEINGLLRQSGIKDEYRPAVVGAIMLALWQSHGNIRKDQANILVDINEASKRAFWKAGKPELQSSLRVDEANLTLALNARRIVAILERLNVHVLTAEHDYLGQLYETFSRYTGGNTIGQYFTPRHVAWMMAELTDVGQKDIVLDPACGTGGFLIAAMNRVQTECKLSRGQVAALVKDRLIGYDKEPVTAALCVANMILRGDGKTRVQRGDAFTADNFPVGQATVSLLNPPFPHKKTDTPTQDFVERALEGLAHGGRLGVLIPTSLLVKKDIVAWRNKIKKNNTIEAVISFERELWHPYADAVTSILLIKKGLPHRANKDVFFAKVHNDGFRVIKQMRVPVNGGQIEQVVAAFREHSTIPGLCGWSTLQDSWGSGLSVPAKVLSPDELLVD